MFQERHPQLSYQISKQFFDENLADQTDSFDLAENEDGAFYVRTIAENDLEAAFEPGTDGKTIALLNFGIEFVFLDEIS